MAGWRIRPPRKARSCTRAPDQVRWDFVRRWLTVAERDLRVAEVIVAADLPSYEGASFHAQQGVEKALKALLTRHQVEFRKTHDLGELLQLAEPVAPGVSAALAGVEVLIPHAVDTRYFLAEVTREEAARHVEMASAALDRVIGSSPC